MSNQHINDIYQFGDQYALDREIDVKNMLEELKAYSGNWSQYNPRKPHIKRQGLCVLNNLGKVGSGPALDSLKEYNRLNNTNIQESDCNKQTEVYRNSKVLKKLFQEILPWCVRTHFLKLGPGGFFPPHRDHTFRKKQSTFRMIVPINNCNPPYTRFIIEDKSLYWEIGRLYVVNTTKQHSFFNLSSSDDSLWLLITTQLSYESVNFVANHLFES